MIRESKGGTEGKVFFRGNSPDHFSGPTHVNKKGVAVVCNQGSRGNQCLGANPDIGHYY